MDFDYRQSRHPRHVWLSLMAAGQYEYQRLFLDSVRQDAVKVLSVFEAREIPVPKEAREQVMACFDPTIMGFWLEAADDIGSVEQLLVLGEKVLHAERAAWTGRADGEPDLGEISA